MADSQTVAAILMSGLMPEPIPFKPGRPYIDRTDVEQAIHLGLILESSVLCFRTLVRFFDDPEPARAAGLPVPILTQAKVPLLPNQGEGIMQEQDHELISAIIAAGMLKPLQIPKSLSEDPSRGKTELRIVAEGVGDALRVFLVVLETLKLTDAVLSESSPLSHPHIPKHGRRHHDQ